MECIRISRVARLCYDPERVAGLLAECIARGRREDECLEETGWYRYRDHLEKTGTLELAKKKLEELKASGGSSTGGSSGGGVMPGERV